MIFVFVFVMTTLKSFVVQGEAAESDDDEGTVNRKYGVAIVDGEAPESDEEIASFSTLPSVNYAHMKSYYSTPASPLRIQSVEESLLHKKLCERNLSLWNSLNAFIQSTVASTSKQLIVTDQLLVQSQVTLQTASRTIKKANETTSEVTEKFKAVVNGNFIPPITLS